MIVLTGGPYSGKTTLASHFSGLGNSVIPESAIEVIEMLNGWLGINEQKDWRTKNFQQFQKFIFDQQVLNEQRYITLTKSTNAFNDKHVFLDRSTIDVIAYLRLNGLRPSREMLSYCESAPYKQIYLLEVFPDFEARSETGRTSDYEKALHTGALLKSCYEEFGYDPIVLPCSLSTEERANMVYEEIGAY